MLESVRHGGVGEKRESPNTKKPKERAIIQNRNNRREQEHFDRIVVHLRGLRLHARLTGYFGSTCPLIPGVETSTTSSTLFRSPLHP